MTGNNAQATRSTTPYRVLKQDGATLHHNGNTPNWHSGRYTERYCET